MNTFDELQKHGGLIETHNAIFLGYDEAADYRLDELGKFRVRWLINGKLYFLDANSKYINFIKPDEWDWNKAEPAQKFNIVPATIKGGDQHVLAQ